MASRTVAAPLVVILCMLALGVTGGVDGVFGVSERRYDDVMRNVAHAMGAQQPQKTTRPVPQGPIKPAVRHGPFCHGAPTVASGEIVKLKVNTPTDGVREVAVYIPTTYNMHHQQGTALSEAPDGNYTAAAVYMLFHGLNDECEHFLDAVGFIEYAERDGFVIASACGSSGWLGTGWNAGTCCGFFSESKPDELAFALAILDTLNAHQICVDSTRVMAVGFSNGAMLAEVLACQKPQVFRSVVSVGGVVEMRPGNDEGITKCDDTVRKSGTTRRANVLMVHGDADVQVPWSGNSFLGFPPVEKNVAGWVYRHGCRVTPETTLNTTTYVNFVHRSCEVSQSETEEGAAADTSIVELVKVRGGQHRWPEDDEFSTTDYIYTFGRQTLG